MIRNDQQIAINEVIREQKGIFFFLQKLSQQVGDKQLSSKCEQDARFHLDCIDALNSIIQEMEDLPRAPNADMIAVEEALMQIKAQLSSDADLAFLNELRGFEKKLIDTVSDALKFELPEAAMRILNEIRSHSLVSAKEFDRIENCLNAKEGDGSG